jgi:hypothetical protein
MKTVLTWVSAISLVAGSLGLGPAAQANSSQDFSKIKLSSAEYSIRTSNGQSVHCVFLYLTNQNNQARSITTHEQYALKSNITLIDQQRRAHDAQLIASPTEEFPDSTCTDWKINNRIDIPQCLGKTEMSHYGKRSCYLLRVDTPMNTRGSYLQLDPLKGQPIRINL